MKDLKLSGQSLAIENFDLVLVEGNDATIQRIDQKFQIWLGEWFLDINAGVPWLENVMGQRPSEQVMATLLRDVVSNDPGIDELLEISINFVGESRKLEIIWSARLIDETIVQSEVTI